MVAHAGGRAGLWALCLIVASGCAHHTFARADRVAENRAHSNKTYALSRSYYISQLYDDNERWLLSERPSHEISHRVSLGGHAIHPPKEIGVLPAGTPMVLERIEFPTRTAVMHRMLNSPVHHIWLRLRPAPGALVSLPVDAHPFVLVLKDGIADRAELAGELGLHLTSPEAATLWLDGLAPALRAAVQAKQVVRGMDERTLLAAAGEPRAWRDLGRVDGHATRVARYDDLEVWLEDGIVTDLRTSALPQR